jgi:hypothetical protein
VNITPKGNAMTRGSSRTARLATPGFRAVAVPLGLLLSSVTAAAAEQAAAPAAGFRCRAGDVRGVPEADALTAVEMVCSEIRRLAPGTGTYAVSLGALGRQIVLTAAREDETASITLLLETIEEVSTSAPRVAEALVGRKPLATTQRVDNLLESETRRPLSKRGSVKFATGVAGFSPLGHGGSGAGFSIGLTYAAPQLALPVALRVGWTEGAGQDKTASFFAISAGARRYFSRRDVSAFAGAGVSMLKVRASEWHLGVEWPGRGFDAERFGAAPYLEAGVEVLRLHRARLAFALQLDFPTGPLRSEGYTLYTTDAGRRQRVERVIPAESRYVVPASLGVTITF